MTGVLQHRRSNTAGVAAATPAAGEVLINTDNQQLYVGNGVDAGGFLVGRLIIESKTSTYAVLATDNGKHFNNAGAGGAITFNLLAAVPGLSYGFGVADAQNVIVDANGTDIIVAAGLSSSAGGNFSSNVQYSFLLIECHVAGVWMISSMIGPWTAA